MTELGRWLVLSPLWLIFVILFGGLFLCAWFGWSVRQKLTSVGSDRNEGKSDSADYVLTSVTGLLALLVGFTFALAIDRYDARRVNVLNEANHIRTTYLRTQVLEEPYRTQLSRLLLEYTNNRVTLAEARPSARQTELLRRNDALLNELWKNTVLVFPSIRPYDFSSGYLETMNSVINMDATRKASRRAHVPPAVFVLLFIYQYVAAGVYGYVMVGKVGRFMAAFVMFLFALSVIFVIDIDRPVSGIVRESQEPMLWLQASMQANPPQAYGPSQGREP
jgi:hypothetical protein